MISLPAALKATAQQASIDELNMLKDLPRHRALSQATAMQVCTSGSRLDVQVENTRIEMYLNCGQVENAARVFEELNSKNVQSWSLMITAFARCRHIEEAMKFYHGMIAGGFKPNRTIYLVIFGICSNLSVAKSVHSRVASSGLGSDLTIQIALVNMYIRCRSYENAKLVFDGIHDCSDLFCWTGLIAASAKQGFCTEAFHLYRLMNNQGIAPDTFIFASLLRACSSIRALSEGRLIHERMLAMGFHLDTVVTTALLDMYARCGSLLDARRIFDEMQHKDVTSWTAMITAYAHHGHPIESINLFRQMDQEGLQANHITLTNIVTAFSSLGNLTQGKLIHARILAMGFDCDPIIHNALVNMYSKCSSIQRVVIYVDSNNQRASEGFLMTAAFVEQDQSLRILFKMGMNGCKPDPYTFASALSACSNLGALAEGKVIHEYISAAELETNTVVGTALVNLYGNCGQLQEAHSCFDRILWKDVACWSAMITAYAEHGHVDEAVDLVKKMEIHGCCPNELTFTSLLHACGHAGLLNQARIYFLCLQGDYGIAPVAEHYACIIDLLERAGQPEDAEDLLQVLSLQLDAAAWNHLLGVHDRARSAANKVKLKHE